MLVSFTVKNFRGLRELTVAPLGRINLIAGRNNTGKTTLLEAIYLQTNPGNSRLIVQINTSRGIGIDSSIRKIKVATGWLFSDKKVTPDIQLISKDDRDVVRETRLSVVRHHPVRKIDFVDPTTKTKVAATIKEADRPALFLRYSDSKGAKGEFYSYLTKKGVDSLLHRSPPSASSRFLRSTEIPSSSENEDFSRIEANDRQDELLAPLRILEPRLERLALLVFGDDPSIHAKVDQKRLIPISFMGEGMRRLLSIVLAIANCPGGVVLIDEVENGLHHSVMRKIWEAIEHAARRADAQVFATTHSYECIKAAHEAALNDEQYDLRFHRLDRVGEEISAATYDRETLDTSVEMNLEVR